MFSHTSYNPTPTSPYNGPSPPPSHNNKSRKDGGGKKPSSTCSVLLRVLRIVVLLAASLVLVAFCVWAVMLQVHRLNALEERVLALEKRNAWNGGREEGGAQEITPYVLSDAELEARVEKLVIEVRSCRISSRQIGYVI